MEAMEKEISYVAKRYRRGKFATDKGWQRLGIAPSQRWRRMRVAAAIVSVIALSAVAAIFYHEYSLYEEPIVERQMPETPDGKVRAIDFEDAPLPDVVARISEVYGVEVTGVPDNAGDYRLSLHYEGNVAALIETINEILGTNMAVKE